MYWVVTLTDLETSLRKLLGARARSVLERMQKWVYVNGGTCPEPPEPPGTARNRPEPTGTPRNPPEPTRNLEKSANDKIKKKQITKNNTNQIKIMKMK